MIDRSMRPGRERLTAITTGLIVLVAGLALGGSVSARPKYFLVGAVVLAGAALVAQAPVNLAVVAVPSCLLVQRLPIGSSITISDAVLAAASVAAIPALVRRPTPVAIRGIRRWLAVYLAALTVVLLVNLSGRAGLEWAHRLVLVGGALGVGMWLAAEGRVRISLRMLVIGAALLGMVADVKWISQHFHGAAQPLGYNKNFLGPVLVMTLLVILVAPRAVALPRTLQPLAVALLATGAVASQSRGALLGGAAGALTVAFARVLTPSANRSENNGRILGSLALVAVTAGFGIFVYNSVTAEQRQVSNGTQTINSITLRYGVEDEAHRLFRREPITGNGIRYFQNPAIAALSPEVVAANNVIDEALAEGGVVDLVGLVLFSVGSIVVIVRHRRHPLALAGLALVVDRLVRGQVDIFWLAGDAALPWLVTGMGLYLGRSRSGSPDAAGRVRASDRRAELAGSEPVGPGVGRGRLPARGAVGVARR